MKKLQQMYALYLTKNGEIADHLAWRLALIQNQAAAQALVLKHVSVKMATWEMMIQEPVWLQINVQKVSRLLVAGDDKKI